VRSAAVLEEPGDESRFNTTVVVLKKSVNVANERLGRRMVPPVAALAAPLTWSLQT